MRYERGPAAQRGGGALRGCLVVMLIYVVLAVGVGAITTILNGGMP